MQALQIQIPITIDRDAAIAAGHTQHGATTITPTEEQLAGLTPEERSELARVDTDSRIGGHWRATPGWEERRLRRDVPLASADWQEIADRVRTRAAERARSVAAEDQIVAAEREQRIVAYLTSGGAGSDPGGDDPRVAATRVAYAARKAAADEQAIIAWLADPAAPDLEYWLRRDPRVEAESARRRSARDERRRADEAARVRAIREILLRSGATEEQIARYDAGVLPDDERDTLIEAVVLAPLAGLPRYGPISAADGLALIDSEDVRDEADVQITGQEHAGALTAEQWAAWQRITTATAQISGATVERRERSVTAEAIDYVVGEALYARVRVSVHGVELRATLAID